jgi:hypothetical protein
VSTATITGTALLLALGVVLPIVFHAFPLGGRIFLPMHLPTFIAGLVLGPTAGLVVGAGSPIVSALLTGRPPVFYMVPMMFELATYGVVAGILRMRLASVVRSPFTAVPLALLGAMLAGRVVWIAVVVWLAPVIGIQARTPAMAFAAIGAGWIGMIIQLALIPPIVRAIERVRNS